MDFGDGYIWQDSLPPDNYGKPLHSHAYLTPIDSSVFFDIKLVVTNSKGVQDSITRQVTIEPYPPKVPDISDSTRAGYYNVPGSLIGLINDQSVRWETNDSSVFSGSQMFELNRGSGGYIYSMMFSRGNTGCDLEESFVMLLPLFHNEPFAFEKGPPALQFAKLKDSLKVGRKVSFYYVTPTGPGISDEIFQSKTDAELIDIQEVNVDSNFYYSVYTKGFDATFSIKSDEFATTSNKQAHLKVDLVIKMRLLVDRRHIQNFSENAPLLKFCF